MDSALSPPPAADQTTFADAFVRQFLHRHRNPSHIPPLLKALPSGLTAANPFQETHDLLVVMSSRGFDDHVFTRSAT